MKKMANIILLLASLGLLACTTEPKAEIPALRMAVEASHSKASVAIQSGDAEGAADWWALALAQYQALDDWAGQGMARLGLAQAQARLGRFEVAKQTLKPMLAQPLFNDLQRAQANLQFAQVLVTDIASEESKDATQYLVESERLCASPCVLRWAQMNLTAKIALRQQSFQLALTQLHTLLMQAPATERVEIAHAYHLQAQAQLALQLYPDALQSIDAALILDRQLARPEWLLADYRVQLDIVRALNDVEKAALVEQKIASLCEALQCR